MDRRTSRRPAVVGALVWLLLAACGDSAERSPGTDPPTTTANRDRIVVDVTVTLGPGCPVEREGQPCPSVPLAGYDVVATSGERSVRRELPADGRVVLDLPAGVWTITATAGMSCDTATVSDAGPVTVACDTGIR